MLYFALLDDYLPEKENQKQETLVEAISKMSIATGKWGCGVFRGNPELKYLIQVLAANMAGRDIIFCLSEGLEDIHEQYQELFQKQKMTVGELYLVLREVIRNLERRGFDESKLSILLEIKEILAQTNNNPKM